MNGKSKEHEGFTLGQDSATHECGGCGKHCCIEDTAPSRSPCCPTPLWSRQGTQMCVLGIPSSEGRPLAVDWFLIHGAFPGSS